ncbi:hypothetical protein S40285_08653 [Stachybotrys chlorohalonatus IBT 40285]|uniref:Methyltransferase domain-containing protein n=1 Tax=Stachybotrys chlorohalonatus (strain IBT 40285) TaxID=1283841 RepID=A0A084QLK5_STAC4|nr:hypothetical protein S40285_08653 [Stachybotrys chlorohalonata IBT 40285]
MLPDKTLPYNGDFSSAEDYVDQLLHFASTSDLFQILCGGVHILDFFTMDVGLFHAALPEEWHEFLLSRDLMVLLDLFMRDDLDDLPSASDGGPPESLVRFIRDIRKFSLGRSFAPGKPKLPALPRSVKVGMNPKKIHEVTNFVDYVDRLAEDVSSRTGDDISHVVDFGSGQNYLGRALASEPYNRHVVAVEGRENNVAAARYLDLKSGLAIQPKVRRNKKMWDKILSIAGPDGQDKPEVMAAAIQQVAGHEAFDFRPPEQVGAVYGVKNGTGLVQYISGRLDSGDLGDVIARIEKDDSEESKKLKLMAVSIHSCGNLSHHAIRSLILNQDIRAIAIVGCCYNMLTERLGPPVYKHTYLRPTLQALNGRVFKESDKHDPHGFPMSQRFCSYNDYGVRLNITARMMACQAPYNWTRGESDNFFDRHFYRAVIQRMFLDRGVVGKVRHREPSESDKTGESKPETPFDTSTNPIVIGSLRKPCYNSLKAYVRGVVEKLTTSEEYKQYSDVMQEKMGDVTDEEIERYERTYLPRRPELCVIWSLMAFAATVAESLIVTDRWTFLKEHGDVVQEAWVETVFDYRESPRNLVVVGIKKKDAP